MFPGWGSRRMQWFVGAGFGVRRTLLFHNRVAAETGLRSLDWGIEGSTVDRVVCRACSIRISVLSCPCFVLPSSAIAGSSRFENLGVLVLVVVDHYAAYPREWIGLFALRLLVVRVWALLVAAPLAIALFLV